MAANAERAADVISAHPEAELAVFPELYLSGYTYRGLSSAAREPDSQELGLVRGAAGEARTAVIIGFAERVPDGIANSVACFDEGGELAAVYRKTFLFGEEESVFVPGNELVLVTLSSVKVAPQICFDIEFPEPARRLAESGAELIVTVSANFEPFALEHDVPTISRAIENRLPHLYVNMVGSGDGLDFVGRSRSVSPLGEVLHEAPRDREDVSVVPIADRGGVDPRADYVRLVREIPAVTDRS